MSRIAASRSTGASAGLICLMLAAPLVAGDFSGGQAAYAARDYAVAAAIWRREAAAGSAEAELGLGNLADFGLLGPRDPGAALEHYLTAALAGLPQALFNVAALTEAQGGADMDTTLWYGCAAAMGHDRARYVLGQIFRAGQGVPANPDLARDLLQDASAQVRAAAAALNSLAAAQTRVFAAPEPLGSIILHRDNAVSACLMWTAPPLPEGTTVRVDLADGDATLLEQVPSDRPVLVIPLPDTGAPLFWRVVAVAPQGETAASSWRAMDVPGTPMPPAAAVSFLTNPGDAKAAAMARRLGAALDRSGIAVAYGAAAAMATESRVTYRYPGDAGFAAEIASFLPGMEGAALSDKVPARPGEVVVTLVFDR